MTAATLDRLETLAGASDQDREAWLAERRGGLTATQVRDLWLERHGFRTYTTWDELIAQKLGLVPEEDLSHVPVIRWGQIREPVIAEIIQRRYGIAPESRVFRAADDPRKLASPDGVGIYGFDEQLVVAEVKTAGKSVAPWTDAYAEKGYEIQQQWVMRVLGAERSLFAWEIRQRMADGDFRPGLLQFEWVQRNEALIAALDELADEFLAALDAARAAGPVELVIDEQVDTHAVNYLRGLQLEKDAKALKEPAYRALVAAGKSQTSSLAKVTFTPAKAGVAGEVDEIDYAAAEAAAPELFAEMRRTAEAWAAHCEGFTRKVPVAGKSSPAKVTVTAVKTGEQ